MLMCISKLDAINTILSSIGSDPVNSLDDTDVDVMNALRLLENESRKIQRQGWLFNTESITLTPDKYTHKIYWDNSMLAYKSQDGNNYVKRGDYLYDITNSTDNFTAPVVLSVIRAVDFEDLPDCFREYITAKTAVEFQMRYLGDTNVAQDLMIAVQQAQSELVSYDINSGNYNMLQFTGVSENLQRT